MQYPSQIDDRLQRECSSASGEVPMLRCHDYVNIAGGFRASQLTSEYVVNRRRSLPTERRAYMRGPDRRPILEMLKVAIDISKVSFT
jgi:hypothetical protein